MGLALEQFLETDEGQAWLNQFHASPFVAALKELERVKEEPRLLVIITHGMVELMVSALIENHCKRGKKINNDSRGYPHSAKLMLLNELGVMSDHHFTLLDWLRDIRNKFAHKPFFTLTADRLDNFADARFRDPANLHELCRAILQDIIRTFGERNTGSLLIPPIPGAEPEPVLMVEAPAPAYLIPLKSDPKTVHVRAELL